MSLSRLVDSAPHRGPVDAWCKTRAEDLAPLWHRFSDGRPLCGVEFVGLRWERTPLEIVDAPPRGGRACPACATAHRLLS